MNSLNIDTLSASVARAYKLQLPIDFSKICYEEGIELAPGEYSDNFHGRLEFHPSEAVFILYHPKFDVDAKNGRIRFSICHELGHYFIEEHRNLIVSGKVHNSLEPFKPAKNRIEGEADRFAAALLIPEHCFWAFMGSRKELPLSEILRLAHFAQTSIQAAAFRYVSLTNEPCVAVVSKGNQVLRSYSSPSADARGFHSLGNTWVPDDSTALRCLNANPFKVIEGHSNTSFWFSERGYGSRLWEESIRIGMSNFSLTVLSWPEFKAD